jgi:hypothetical protein
MDDIENDTITIDNTIINSTGGYATINSMNTANTMWASGSSSIYNIPSAGTGGQIYTTNGTGNSMWTTAPYITTAGSNGSSGIQVKGDAEFEGKVMINGRDISKLFERIEDRLAILMEPDPEKLEKFAALKKAYDNYKLLEKLIGDDEPNDKR